MHNRILRFLVCSIFMLILSGCLSVSRSPSPRYYKLDSMSQQQIKERFKVAENQIIGVGPVKIPEYLNRPQITTINNNMITFAQFDRWAEPLDFAIARILNENLILITEAKGIEMFPWNMMIPVRFQVVVDLIELDANMSENLIFTAQWSILDISNKTLAFSKRSVLKEAVNPRDYSGVVKAMNTALSKISIEIAGELSRLPIHENNVQRAG